MKRHKSLHPLSHDHHHGLVHARRLSQASLAVDPVTLRGMAQELLDFWHRELRQHFQIEEEVLLPAFSKAADARRPEIVETLVQHVELRRRIEDVRSALEIPADPTLAELNELGRLLHEHIRYEEDVVFPAIEAAMGEEQLVRLAERLRPPGVN